MCKLSYLPPQTLSPVEKVYIICKFSCLHFLKLYSNEYINMRIGSIGILFAYYNGVVFVSKRTGYEYEPKRWE